MTTANNTRQQLAGLAQRVAPRRLARPAVALATLLAIVVLAGGPPGITRAQGAEQTVNGTLTIVNNGPGDQLDPHISGALVAYTSAIAGNSEIRYHDLLTGVDASIPNPGGLDILPDVSGTTIVYTHLSASGSAIDAFDTSTAGPPVELDPQRRRMGDDATDGCHRRGARPGYQRAGGGLQLHPRGRGGPLLAIGGRRRGAAARAPRRAAQPPPQRQPGRLRALR
ncbi:MAG: hypothetical protein ACJ8CR_20850 [Roseiflexaceae bacterium]